MSSHLVGMGNGEVGGMSGVTPGMSFDSSGDGHRSATVSSFCYRSVRLCDAASGLSLENVQQAQQARASQAALYYTFGRGDIASCP